MSAAATKSKGSSLARVQPSLFIYDLPLSKTQELCDHLDALGVWMQLANRMGFGDDDIKNIGRRIKSTGGSPTYELLNIWGGKYNHKVLELYIVLHRLKAFHGMRIIKDFVPREFQLLIPDSGPALSKILPSNPAVKRSNNNEGCTSSGVTSTINTNSSTIVSSDDNNIHQQSNYNNNSWKSRSNLHHPSGREPHQLQPQLKSVKQINNHHETSLPELDYEEITNGTDNWNEKLKLGEGGFGVVYRGVWKHIDVAIKLMSYKGNVGRERAKIQLQQSRNELNCLYRFRHDNILPIYGYCAQGEKPCLVYQLMKGGSLQDRFNTNKYALLPVQKRIDICLGTARGIFFLHTLLPNKSLIHCDIKPGNILLDQCLQPKIGDFGLAREGPKDNSYIEVAHVCGTRAYLPPEFVNLRRLSKHVDTYSFGVVLLEMFTGLRSIENKNLLTNNIKILLQKKTTEDLVDPRIELTPEEKNLCKICIDLAIQCIKDDPLQRPNMEDVVTTLNSYATDD
uniref:non-specific serine/threonine protein kinase n=1 Tax=Stomoxys calcitrans TaxID=35570 RepID=A0A1I8P9Z3_STOCA